MIWPNSVMHALYTALSSDSVLVSSGVTVELDEVFNSDPNRTPWVGVYFGEVAIEPRRSNVSRPWLAAYSLLVYAQDHSHAGGQDAKDRVNRLLTPVLTAINSDKTLGGTVNIVNGLAVTPFQRNLEEDDWFFTDEILITAEVDA